VNRRDPSHGRLDLLAMPMAPQFDVRVVILEPGCELVLQPSDWLDALVEVDEGAVELELPSGAIAHFDAGDLVWLSEGRLRALSSGGEASAVLVAVSRHADPLLEM
jgi:quercetin dioxygenase-like cupin family protein